MSLPASPFASLEELNSQIHRTANDPRPVVVMTCGIAGIFIYIWLDHVVLTKWPAGSGKSSLSKGILSRYPSFERLSIDSYIYQHHGLYDTDYPPEKYSDYQEEAEKALRGELISWLRHGARDVILDFSFAFQATRNDWKALVQSHGGRWMLVYLDVDNKELHRRVAARNALVIKNGDSAFPVTEEILEGYIAGFERPIGEGEIILRPSN